MNTLNESQVEYGWGGSWTEKKLDAFVKYVKEYLTILHKYPNFKTIYFDGFAGSGQRKQTIVSGLFEDLNFEGEGLYQGAAERLIRLEKKFDYYYFVEKNADDLKTLELKLRSIDEAYDRKMEFRSDDCNEQVRKLAAALKKDKSLAALIFLDPFGMQLDWETIESLEGTRSDVWILVPTGVIINRLLDQKGELMFSKKLETFFGLKESEIREHFYKKSQSVTLFGEEVTTIQKVLKPIQKIADIYRENLEKVWQYVTPHSLPLINNSGTPIFHFVFASNNQAAIRIAKYIIEKS